METNLMELGAYRLPVQYRKTSTGEHRERVNLRVNVEQQDPNNPPEGARPSAYSADSILI